MTETKEQIAERMAHEYSHSVLGPNPDEVAAYIAGFLASWDLFRAGAALNIHKVANLQIETGGSDDYSVGLYNGIHMAESLVEPTRQYKPMSLHDFKIVQKQMRMLRDKNNEKLPPTITQEKTE